MHQIIVSERKYHACSPIHFSTHYNWEMSLIEFIFVILILQILGAELHHEDEEQLPLVVLTGEYFEKLDYWFEYNFNQLSHPADWTYFYVYLVQKLTRLANVERNDAGKEPIDAKMVLIPPTQDLPVQCRLLYQALGRGRIWNTGWTTQNRYFC